jgi:hypothetical protein
MTDQPSYERYTVPAGHEEFVEAFETLMQSFPASASRFALADLGDAPQSRRVVGYKCRKEGPFVVCDVPIERPQ